MRKIIIFRIIITLLIVSFLLFPFESAGLNFTKLFINESIVVNIKYFIVGILFFIAIVTEIIDSFKKSNDETQLTLNSLLEKTLIDSILIVLSSQGFLHPIIPVIVVSRDYIVSAIRMNALKNGKVLKDVKITKIKNIILKVGILLTLFYNLPFELININISDMLLIVGTVLSVISCIQYYGDNKKKITINS